jgi:hypothetical protein
MAIELYCNQSINGTLNTTGIITSGGIITAPGGTSTEWNTSYDNMITAFSDSGSSTITLTLTQQDGGTLTTSFSNPQGTVTSVTAGTYLTNIGTAADVILDHDNTSRSNNSSSVSPAYGASFTVIDTINTNTTGHVTVVNTKTVTLPAAEDYTWTAAADAGSNRIIQSGNTIDFTGGTNINTENASVYTRFHLDDSITLAGTLTVNGTGQSSFGGQVTVPTTPSAGTDAASKSYVDAHTSGIGGSGTTNFIPMFTPNGTTLGNSQISQANIGTGNAKRITVASRMTITGSGGDADGGTLNLSSNSARLGICTSAYPGSITEPEASLDVGKNARIRGSLNVGSTNEQYLFVSTTGDNPVGYVKMGYYGSGVEWGSSTSTTRTPQYSTGFGSGGKVVEDARYYTFKISFANMATIDTSPRVLIAQDTGLYTYIVEDFYVFQDNASSNNPAPVFNSDLRLDYKYTPGVGTVRTSTAWVVPQATISRDANLRKRRTLMQGVSAGALSVSGAGLQEGTGTAYARASVILTASSVTSQSGSGDYYLRLKVKKINIGNDIINNTQTITIT